jgi:hypothetical protein
MNFDKGYILSGTEWRGFIFEIADYLGYDIDNLSDFEIENIAQEMISILEENGLDCYVILHKFKQPSVIYDIDFLIYEIKDTLGK